jgi:N-glycosylase/DNA lyase
MASDPGVFVLLLLFACAEHIVMGDVRTTTVSLGEILLSMMMGRKGSRWWMCAIPYFYTSFCFWRCRDVPDYLNRSDELMREFTFVQICAKVECV